MESLRDYLVFLNLYYQNMGQNASEERSQKYDQLIENHGREWVRKLKQNNHNQRLATIVQNTNEIKKMYETRTEIIQKKDPIFMDPLSDMGRAHFYAPHKNIKGYEIDTLWFNLFIIWIGAGILYYTLIFDVLRKLLRSLEVFLSGLSAFTNRNKNT
jgi:hypothetical protein